MPVIPDSVDKFRGLKNTGRQQKAGKGQFREALNVDIDNSEIIRRRKGSDIIYRGSPSYLITDGTDLLFREGGDLKRLEPGFSSTVIRSGFSDPPRRMASLLLNGLLYYSDGEQLGIYHAGYSRSWGLPVPPAPAVVPTVGDLLPGIYQIALTYRRGDGQESGASKPVFVNSVQGGFTVSIVASSDPDVTGICFYVSSVDGKIPFRQAVMPNADATFTLSGGTLASGVRLLTQNMRAPYPGDHMCFFNGRVYIASGPTIRYTEPWNYELMSMDQNSLPFQGDVRMMVPVEAGIWVATYEEAMLLAGKDPMSDGGFQIKSRNTHGALKGAFVTVNHSDLSIRGLPPGPCALWMSKDGVILGDSAGNVMSLTGDYFIPPAGNTEGWACLLKEDNMDRVMFGMKVGVGLGASSIVVT